MKLNKTIKKLIAVVCALAMVVTSVTVSHVTAKADVADIEITASATADGRINANWTNPEGTVRTRCYVNQEDNQHYAKAANGWVWSENAPNEVRTSLDTVVGTNGGLNFEDGGDFTIIVVAYSDETCETVIGRGTSESVHIDANTNTDLQLKLDRYTNDGKNSVISWKTIGGSAKYVVYNEDQVLKEENNGGATWTEFENPTTEKETETYICTVKVYRADGSEIEVTNNTLTLNKYSAAAEPPVEVEEKPEDQDTYDTEGLEWELLGTSGSGIVEKNYSINSNHTLNKDATWYKVYAPHSDAGYHAERTNCKLGDKSAFVFKFTPNDSLKSVWVNGERYANGSEDFNHQGDCAEIATEVFNKDVNVVTLVSNDGTTTTFAIKAEDPAKFVQPTISPDSVSEWTKLAGTSETGASAYVDTAIVESFGNGGLRGFYGAGQSANWNISDAMKEVPVFGFVTSGNHATRVVITDTTDAGKPVEVYNDYAKDSAATNAYIGSDCVYINQDLLDAGAGETKYYTITALDSSVGVEGTFLLKVVGPEPTVQYDVKVDNDVKAQVEEGGTYKLPEDAEYGYYCEGKMYKPGAEVTVNAAMEFTSVKELSVTMATGAGIKTSVPAGLRFQATVASDNATALADQNVIKEGTLITANDIYENGGNNLTLSSAYTYLTVENTGWYNGQTGTYCGAIAGIAESNYIRDFVARAYVTVEYEDGTETTVYSDMSSVRSIKYVAEKVAQAGYPGLGDEEKGIIDGFAAAK